jgi:hypothetical protein
MVPNTAIQFDWSEEGLVIGGVYRKLQVAHMKLCASRAFWIVAYPVPRIVGASERLTEMLNALRGSRRPVW